MLGVKVGPGQHGLQNNCIRRRCSMGLQSPCTIPAAVWRGTTRTLERSAHFHPPIAVGRGRFVLWGRRVSLSHSRPQNITLRVHRASGIVHHHTHGHDLAGLGHSSRADEVPGRSAARLSRARWRPRKGWCERKTVSSLRARSVPDI